MPETAAERFEKLRKRRVDRILTGITKDFDIERAMRDSAIEAEGLAERQAASNTDELAKIMAKAGKEEADARRKFKDSGGAG